MNQVLCHGFYKISTKFATFASISKRKHLGQATSYVYGLRDNNYESGICFPYLGLPVINN